MKQIFLAIFAIGMLFAVGLSFVTPRYAQADELGVNGKVWLSMDGALKPARTGGKAGMKVLGKLTVNLSADVNEMIAILPGFDDAVNLINDTVIANLQGSINATVADDYAKGRVAAIAKTRVNA